MARQQLTLVTVALAVPVAGLAYLLADPSADVHWQHQPSHFWLVLVTAGLNAVLAYATGVAARRRGDQRVHLVSLAFLAASGFLAMHALATPGVLLDRPNLGFVIATPIGLAVAGAFAAASALDVVRVPPTVLQYLLLASLAVWLVVSLALLPELDDASVPERMSWPLVVLAFVGLASYGFAVGRYLTLWRKRGSSLILALAVAFILLAESMLAVALGRNWQASWWERHVLMLIAFALIAFMAHREGPQERFARLYLDKDAQPITVLFADLEGFSTYSEQHDPTSVSQMLNVLFDAVIPAVEEYDGEVDRLIGDAVFATFQGDGHPERAARAALALQAAAVPLAEAHPYWPRFRAGVNTGEASVGVLGTGSGRTYSVVGDTVNLGARIEGLAPAGGVAISGETARGLWGATTEPLGTIVVRGREEAVEVLLLVSLPPR